MKSQWIEHQGREILNIDFSNFHDSDSELQREVNNILTGIGKEMYSKPLHSVLVLVDLRNTKMTSSIQKIITERITDTRKYVAKTAVLGMTGIRKAFLDYFGRIAMSDTRAFDDFDTAANWLLE